MSDQFYLPEYLDALQEILVASGHDVERSGMGMVVTKGDSFPRHEISTVMHMGSKHSTASILLRTFPAEHELGAIMNDARRFNRLAVLGSVVATPYGPFIGTRFTVHHDLAPDWYVVELIDTAIQFNTRPAHLIAMAPRAEFDVDSGAVRWTEKDFQWAAKSLGRHAKVEVDGRSLTLEIPLGEDSTAIFLLAARHHPQIGPGLFSLLSVPFSIDEAREVEVEAQLNFLEFEPSPTGPPCLGAWCVTSGEPTHYASFVPACVEADYLPYYLSMWAMERAHSASRRFVEAVKAATVTD